MQVILLDSVHNLGHVGDEVRVKPGYARNYLIPQGHAVRATPEARAEVEARLRELAAAEDRRIAEAQKRAESLRDVRVTIRSRAAEEGKLFGSVTNADVIAALTELGHEVHKQEVNIAQGTVKETGEYKVDVILHPDVIVNIPLTVAAEEG